MSRDERTFVIVGASLAGGKAAETLREEGFTGRIVLVGEETEPPYERPPLSKGYLVGNDPREQAFLHEEGWWAEHGIELRLGTRATMLDAAEHTVTLDGVEELRYDKLLLATGSRVRTAWRPPGGGDRCRLDRPGGRRGGARLRRRGDRGGAGRAAAAPGAR
jgi:3-phenylpropionate/trans-cinnamate dioxygenase ferredoxin reductase subunit